MARGDFKTKAFSIIYRTTVFIKTTLIFLQILSRFVACAGQHNDFNYVAARIRT